MNSKDNEYDLFMKTDYGTTGFTQWFYFRISNTRKGQTYKFNVMNMIKPDFLYNQGLKVLLYSTKRHINDNSMAYIEKQSDIKEKSLSLRANGWTREGSSIAYYKNNIQHRPGLNYYTLTFTITTKCKKKLLYKNIDDNDTIYIASDYPYTYSDLEKITTIMCSSVNSDIIRTTTLCKSLAGNSCPLYIITNFKSTPEDIAKRPAIFFTARVHPG